MAARKTRSIGTSRAAAKLIGKHPSKAEHRYAPILIYGPPKVGKTWGAIGFPNPYYIDCEGGSNKPKYKKRLSESNGLYVGLEDGSLDPEIVTDQFWALATTEHNHRLAVLDSVSKIFNKMVVEEGERLQEEYDMGPSDFGASKKPAIAWLKRLINIMMRVKMTTILVAHEKDKWQDGKNIGTTFDCWEKLEYELDLVLRIEERGPSRVAVVMASRLENFEKGSVFPWSYDEFANRYGREHLETKVKPLELATKEQLAEISELIDIIRVEPKEIETWFSKASVESWAEMSTEHAQKVINFLKSKNPATTKDNSNVEREEKEKVSV